MKNALNELISRFPPPAKPRGTPVNWDNLESALDLCLPTGFKEFINTYGGCIWFDNLSPFFRQGRTKKAAREFPEKVDEMCKIDQGNTYDKDGKPFSLPFYPEKGGLFPFLVDYGGNMYYWDTNPSDPDRWPIVQSRGGWMKWYPAMSIPMMILKWLNRDSQMRDMWGDVDKIPPERLQITVT